MQLFKFFTFYMLLFSSLCLHAHPIPKDTLMQADAAPQKSVLYIITDKTLYVPGEVIWFAAYLLPNVGKPDSLVPNILSVALLRSDTTDYTLQKNYFIEKGLCSGSILLPDTISPGTYHLIAATNILNAAGKPIQVFRTILEIKSVVRPAFSTEFNIDDTTLVLRYKLNLAHLIFKPFLPQFHFTSLNFGVPC